jgi:hypothetical protein
MIATLDNLAHNPHFCYCQTRSLPGFVLLVNFRLAARIAAAKSMFNVVNCVLFRPVPWLAPTVKGGLSIVCRVAPHAGRMQGDHPSAPGHYPDPQVAGHRVGRYSAEGKLLTPRTEAAQCWVE